MRGVKRLLAVILLLGLVATGAFSADIIMPSQDSEAKKRGYFTNLKLISQDGKEMRFYSDVLKDRVVIINAFFLGCSRVCPTQNKVLSEMQQLLGDHMGKDIFIVSISVDPANDRPELFRGYAKVFNAGKGWLFLGGKKENVDWVNYRLGYYTAKPEQHLAVYLLGNVKTGHWMKIKPDADAKTLAGHLLRLTEE